MQGTFRFFSRFASLKGLTVAILAISALVLPACGTNEVGEDEGIYEENGIEEEAGVEDEEDIGDDEGIAVDEEEE